MYRFESGLGHQNKNEQMEKSKQGLRFNDGKLRYDLVPPHAIEGMVKVLTMGAKKYEPRNWEKGMSWTTVVASLKRHVAAWEKGEDIDPESGVEHMAHVMCNAAFLMEYYRIYPQGDDRPHRYLNSPRIALDIDEVIADWVGAWTLHHNGQEISPEFWNFDKDIKLKFDELKEDKEFWLGISPKMNPRNLPFEPHCYVTSRSIPNEWSEEWIQKWGFPTVPVYTVGHNQSKVDVLISQKIDIFVDDRYENFVEINKAGICCYLFDAPHNQRYNVGHKRIKDLKELVS